MTISLDRNGICTKPAIHFLDYLYWRTSDFTMSTATSARKCLAYGRLCRPISAILLMLNGCSVLATKESLKSVTNEFDQLTFLAPPPPRKILIIPEPVQVSGSYLVAFPKI